jgi:hypothetical protein
MYFRFISIAAASMLLSNCANMNESDCINANWQLIGFEDGSLGKNESNIANHRKECAEYGVTPELAAYRKGHYLGSEKFCSKNNGFARGSLGKEYQQNCPTQFEPAFLAGFTDGQTVYGLKQTVAHYEAELKETQKNIEQLEKSIARKNEQMIADGLNREQRIAIREDVFQQQQKWQDLTDTLPNLKQELENAQQTYEQEMLTFSHYLLAP